MTQQPDDETAPIATRTRVPPERDVDEPTDDPDRDPEPIPTQTRVP